MTLSISNTTVHDEAAEPEADSLSESQQHDSSIFAALDALRNKFIDRSMPDPIEVIIEESTLTVLGAMDPQNPPSPRKVKTYLLYATNEIITLVNTKIIKGRAKRSELSTLTPSQVALAIMHFHHVVKISPDKGHRDTETDVLAIYLETGPGAGTYSSSEEYIHGVALQYNSQLGINGGKEVLKLLRVGATRRVASRDRDLIAVNNGIFNYSVTDRHFVIDGKKFTFIAKSLHPFDPAFIFTSKSHVDYIANAPEPFITHPTDGTTWDIVSWVNALSDCEGIPELLWEILGAVIRPNVRWGKTAWLYSEKGNNGKGTFCALARELVGNAAHTSIPLSALSGEFNLEPLLSVNAIIVDENDVGTYIDKAANLKAIVTNDVLQINRKFRSPIAFQFYGLMIQCLNGFPRMKDKSESNYRRQLFVPFDKSYTGRERRYIKDDYLTRPEVLEYALWYVLHQAGALIPGCYYEFSEPEATRLVLAEYKESNDPVRQFWNEFREKFVWDLLPFTFLYDLYKAWFAQTNPSGSIVSSHQFYKDLLNTVSEDDMWSSNGESASTSKPVRPGQKMDEPELLIHRYELKDWLNTVYNGSDPVRRSELTNIQANYRGLLRKPSAAGNTTTDVEN